MIFFKYKSLFTAIFLYFTFYLHAEGLNASTSSTIEQEIKTELAKSEGIVKSYKIKSLVLESGNRDPIEGATISIIGSEEEFETDLNGTVDVIINSPHIGSLVSLKITSPGYASQSTSIVLSDTKNTEITVFLTPNQQKTYAMSVETNRNKSEVIQRSIPIKEALKVPGSLGDAVQVVQSLPGVARSPFSLGMLIIRGTSPTESGYFINGIQIPLIYHFQGLTSVINSDLIDNINYLPGGYTARYGRLVGGAVDIQLKKEATVKTHGYAELDILDSSFYLQGNIGKPFSYQLAVRKSNIEYIIAPFLDQLPYKVRAPTYSDAEALLSLKASKNTTLSFFQLYSYDNFKLYGSSSNSSGDDTLLDFSTQFYRSIFNINSAFSKKLSHNLTLAFGKQSEYFEYAQSHIGSKPLEFTIRDDWQVNISEKASFQTGLDFLITNYNFSLTNPNDTDILLYEDESWGYAPAIHTSFIFKPFSDFKILPSIRSDFLDVPKQDYKAFSIDPRISVQYSKKYFELTASFGKYSQFPSAIEFFDEIGNNKLKPYFSLQSSLGFKTFFTDAISLEAIGFYNKMSNLVSLRIPEPIYIQDFLNEEDPFSAVAKEIFTNDGIGRSYGLEVMLKHSLSKQFMGWISYTLSKSERKSSSDEMWRLFDYDQTHILTALASYQLKSGWTFGSRFRIASGSPVTPFTNRYYLVDTGGYIGLRDKALGANYHRLPLFQSLDIRIDKNILFKRWELAFFLEVQNAYNHQNIEYQDTNSSYDYSEFLNVYGLPILPVVGVRGKF